MMNDLTLADSLFWFWKEVTGNRRRAMESKDKKVELLQIAIKQLIEDEKEKILKRASSDDESFLAVRSDGDGDEDGDDADDYSLLSKLLSQLEMLKDDDGVPEELEPSTDIQNVDFPEVGEKNEAANEAGSSGTEPGKEEIVRELKEIKRQNFITHCLLSAMIVLTVGWQLSEVSLILKVKEGLSNPGKFLGGIIKGMIKSPTVAVQEVEKQASAKQNLLLKTSSLPGLKIPKLPHVEIPVFDLDNEEE